MDIRFTVQNKVLERVDDVPLVEGTMNYLYASFEFSADWYGMPKTAVFTHGEDVEQVVLVDDRCLIPAHIVKPESFKVTVYSGNKVITNDAEVNVYTNYPEHPIDPTPDVYEQIVTWIYSLDSRLTIVELNLIHGGGVVNLVGLYDREPSTGADGQHYFNTAENRLYVYAVDRWMEDAAMLGANRLYVTTSDGTVYYYANPNLAPINSLNELQFEVVTELPEIGQSGVIYLLAKTNEVSTFSEDTPTEDTQPEDAQSENVYEEYIWLDSSNRYELLGTTEIDLSNYYTKDEIENLIKDFVAYKPFIYNGQNRKTIELANNDTISGLDTTGMGHNLLMLSQYDVADVGAFGVHLNLNTKDNVTINDKDIVATTADVQEVDDRLTQEVENIRNGLGIYVTINGVQEITNKIINADANEISNLRVSNFNPDAIAQTISDRPSDEKFVTEQAVKQKFDEERLIAGENITISPSNVISAIPDMYEAGENIEIIGNVISARRINYTEGSHIEINGNVINAVDIPEALNDLRNVNLESLQNGQILAYTDGQWQNVTAAQGTVYVGEGYIEVTDGGVIRGSAELDDKFNTKQDELTAGSHIRIYRSTGPYYTLYIECTGYDVGELSDVTISDLATNQVLVYNGTQWVNETLPEGTPYHAGEQITIDNNNLISVSENFQNRVTNLEDNKQNKLVEGDNITISGNTISAFAELGAEDIEYNNGEFTTVAEALDSLLYVAPQITSFRGGANYEAGTVVTNVNLTWAVNKVIVRQSLTQGIGELEPSVRSYSLTGLNWGADLDFNVPSTVSHSIQLYVWDDHNTQDVDTTTVSFQLRKWAGSSPKTSLENSDILALQFSGLSSGRSGEYTLDCSGGRYMYFVIPRRYCINSDGEDVTTFTIGGLTNSDFSITVQTVTNSLGFEETYNIYKSNNIQNDSAISVRVS